MIAKQRSSNIELARILAMAAIVVGHFLCHSVQDSIWSTAGYVPRGAECTCMVMMAFCMFGSNLFILISGYFGIRLTWKKLISYWFLCIFYNFLSVFLNEEISLSSILHCFSISYAHNWFFKAYFWLLLGSIFLNAAIETLDIQKMRLVVIFGFILASISGWFCSNPNNEGMDCLQLFYMYIVGAYLNRDKDFLISRRNQILVYICSCMLCIVFLFLYTKRGPSMAFFHNSPFSIISAVAIFCLFRTIEIKKSNVINSIASVTPAVLLLSDSVFAGVIYGFIYQVSHPITLMTPVAWIGMLIAIFAGAFVIERLRLLVASPLSEKMGNYLSRRFPIFQK